MPERTAGKTKKHSLYRRIRRWKRRTIRRHPQYASLFSLAEGLAGFLVILLIAGGVFLILRPHGADTAAQQPPEAEILAPEVTPPSRALLNTASPATEAPAPTQAPASGPQTAVRPSETREARTEAPQESLNTVLPDSTMDPSALARQMARPGADYSDPSVNKLTKASRIYVGQKSSGSYARTQEIHMGTSDAYTEVEGITTFRGNNYRDTASWGTIPEDPQRISILWRKHVGRSAGWGGVGWTGQASCVRWPEQARASMNINAAKKSKDGLIELIYATLDGHIYFLDMEDGAETRKSLDIGAPIKGSVTVDPRGYPLLYCGQGIYEVDGKKVRCGTRIWSLIDQKLLYFLDGDDPMALRAWRAFDCSPLVDGKTDTVITVGENGVLYTVKLNTSASGGGISVQPEIVRYIYDQTKGGKIGSENSVAVYNNYVYFATNVGIIQCVDLNTMKLVWSFDAQDDIDASLVVEIEGEGRVALYGVNELDKRGQRGVCQMFKLNALTGEVLWVRNSDAIHQNNENGGGGFATPAVGKHDLSGLVFHQIARTEDSGSIVYALDKKTGETVWSYVMGAYGWSSPTCVYTKSGKGYLLVASSNGILRLFDGLTGRVVNAVDLEANIEASPVAFDDLVVVGTRGGHIYGLQIS